jgi:hypothetical protein
MRKLTVDRKKGQKYKMMLEVSYTYIGPLSKENVWGFKTIKNQKIDWWMQMRGNIMLCYLFETE